MDVIYYLIQNMLPVAIPLLLVALGGMFSEVSGVINIALEGIMLCGAFFGALFVYWIQDTGLAPQQILLLAMLIAALAGIIYSLLLSFAAVTMKADQTITGTSLNMLIQQLYFYFQRCFSIAMVLLPVLISISRRSLSWVKSQLLEDSFSKEPILLL
ncbi:MAG: hypothetical protein WAP41_07300 [Tissierellaceae bacterium]